MLTLYFLRHGETTASQSGTYCGTLDLDLTPIGSQMAADFGTAYGDFAWAKAFVSPMKRTIATATPVCEQAELTQALRTGLKEIAYGKWEGLSPAEVNAQFHDDYIRWLSDPGWNAPTGGETGIAIARRSSEVLEEIQDTVRDGNVLIVSHKATIRIMICGLLGIDVGRFRDRIGMPVASLSVVEFGEHGPRLRCLGDRSHIRPELRDLAGH
ncbi:MAG: histidine phosphatase family protein [Cyanobacteria bacterium P01_H01_bin.15]